MTTRELDAYFRSFLAIDGFAADDVSLNGLQVDNTGAPVKKIAFAVDACLETMKRAAASGAGMLFVHHGLFWGRPLAVTGAHRERLKTLLDGDIALYAVHLPLDAHPEVGNNAGLARLLGMLDKEPFGVYHGRSIGFKGRLETPLTVDEAARRIAFNGAPPLAVLPFGKARCETCAVISGGAADELDQAIAAGVDLYVTGEAAHQVYHEAAEAKINFLAGGHYATEVWGVQSVMAKVAQELGDAQGIEVEFINVPTGL